MEEDEMSAAENNVIEQDVSPGKSEETKAVPPVPPVNEKKEKKERKRKSALPGLLLLLLFVAGGSAAWIKRDYLIAFFTRPPWDEPYMITSSVYEGTAIGEEGAEFKASFAIDIASREIWKKIPLITSDVAIIATDLPSGAYLVLSDGKYVMITRKSGKIDASVTFSVAVQDSDPFKRVMFEREPSVTCMLKAKLPEQQIDVEVAGAQSIDEVNTNGMTLVSAALPDGAPVQISWKKALPDLAEGTTEYYSETKTLISVAEGIVTGEAKIDFSILHNPTHLLQLDVPTGVSVLEVAGKDMRDWRLENGKMSIHLQKPAVGAYPLSVKYELSAGMEDGKLKVPVITGAGLGEKGVIGVVALSNIELKNGQLEQAHLIDARDLPQDIVGMTSQPVLLAYRYAEPKFNIELEVSEPNDVDVLLSIIDRAHMTVMQTRDGKRITRAVYNVRNNRSQFLRIALPEGAELWSASVAGRVSQPVKDEQGRILLPLVRSETRSLHASFPVEIVYTDSGDKPDDRGCGKARVALPVSSAPIMNLMVTLHVPAEGRYDDFEGTLREVDQFSSPNYAIVNDVDVSNVAVANIRQIAQQKMQVPHGGRSDIEVQLPLGGKVYRLEKILVIKDQQWFSYNYSRLGR
jgi:hypothetical protein